MEIVSQIVSLVAVLVFWLLLAISLRRIGYSQVSAVLLSFGLLIPLVQLYIVLDLLSKWASERRERLLQTGSEKYTSADAQRILDDAIHLEAKCQIPAAKEKYRQVTACCPNTPQSKEAAEYLQVLLMTYPDPKS